MGKTMVLDALSPYTLWKYGLPGCVGGQCAIKRFPGQDYTTKAMKEDSIDQGKAKEVGHVINLPPPDPVTAKKHTPLRGD